MGSHTDGTASSTAEEEQAAKECVENMEMPKEEVNNEQQAQAPEVPPRPFIHGRHTCDGCLCTPIIGKRFHATNLPDYDLCARCRDNYKGTEIVFEASQLDRDEAFQERWHRKRERWSNHGGPGGPRGQGMPRRHGRRGGGPNSCNRRGPRGNNRGRCHWNHANMDDALKEAIRRSLSDANVEPTEEPAKTEEPTTTVEPTTTEESTQTTAPEPCVPVEAAAESPAPAPSAPSEELLAAEVNVAVAGSIKSAPEEPLVLPPAPTRAPEPVVPKPPSKSSETEESFSSDAAGNGDLAMELGLTLDQCARAISDMMTELDRQSLDAAAASDSDDEKYAISSEAEQEEAPQSNTEEAEVGQSIVDGEEKNENGSLQSEEDEWQVVVEDDQIDGDAALARGLAMVGSALFESEVNGTADADASSLTNSADFSLPSSVPTESNYEISAAVTDRWSNQLFQLHELGFLDDAKNLEILERLNAANIGVDSDEEVSVTQVVSELLGR